MSQVKDLVTKFSKPGLNMVDTCAGTSATASSCLMLSTHRRLIGFNIDAACFEVSITSVREVLARQVLNKKSGIVRSQRILEAANMFLEVAKATATKRQIMVWDSLPRLFTTQTTPQNISQFSETGSKIQL